MKQENNTSESETIINTEGRPDRRDKHDEAIQLNNLKKVYKEIATEFNLNLDLSDFTKVSNSKNARYFSEEGNFLYRKERKRHRFKDSKTIDSIAYFMGKNGNYITICTFCKFTKTEGGAQETIPYEVKVTKDCINNNNNQNLIVLFMLEGDFWTNDLIKEAEFDNKKTFFITRKTVKETLINIFISKQII